MQDLLKRGIGVHHGGLLPIIKEMVEVDSTSISVVPIFAIILFSLF